MRSKADETFLNGFAITKLHNVYPNIYKVFAAALAIGTSIWLLYTVVRILTPYRRCMGKLKMSIYSIGISCI